MMTRSLNQLMSLATHPICLMIPDKYIVSSNLPILDGKGKLISITSICEK